MALRAFVFVLSQPTRAKPALKPKPQPEVNPPKEQEQPQPVASVSDALKPTAQIEAPAPRSEPALPAKVEPDVRTTSDQPTASEVRGRQSAEQIPFSRSSCVRSRTE